MLKKISEKDIQMVKTKRNHFDMDGNTRETEIIIIIDMSRIREKSSGKTQIDKEEVQN